MFSEYINWPDVNYLVSYCNRIEYYFNVGGALSIKHLSMSLMDNDGSSRWRFTWWLGRKLRTSSYIKGTCLFIPYSTVYSLKQLKSVSGKESKNVKLFKPYQLLYIRFYSLLYTDSQAHIRWGLGPSCYHPHSCQQKIWRKMYCIHWEPWPSFSRRQNPCFLVTDVLQIWQKPCFL